mgnify:FL=1
MKTNKKELLDSFKGGLIVSCQVQHDDPTFSVDFVVKMAKAAQWGGAVGIRANDPEQIKAIKKEVDLPVIGLWKIWHDDTDVFITPTLEAAKAVWEAGAEIIALDCTSQITHEAALHTNCYQSSRKRYRKLSFLRMSLIMRKLYVP